LHKGGRSPFAKDSEPAATATAAAAGIDLAGMNERIWRFPEKRDFDRIRSIPGGLLVTAQEWPSTPAAGTPSRPLYRFEAFGGAVLTKLEESIDSLSVSPDGRKFISQVGDEWKVRNATGDPDEGRAVDLAAATVAVNPLQEWRSFYHQAWRGFRALFYDPDFHGQDLAGLERRYEAYLPNLTRRIDLNTLLRRAIGNLSVSHITVTGGDLPKGGAGIAAGATLGADLEVADGRFRFSKIYRPRDLALPSSSRSPFDDTDVAEGDYVISIDGEEVHPTREISSYLLGAAGRRVALTVSRDPSGRNARTVSITPLSGDAAIRQAAWIESNRDYVERRSNGPVAYVYIPDFAESGTNIFLQQWIAATDKSAVVLDQRYNPGGIGGDLVFDYVARRPLSEYAFRDSAHLPFPVISVRGPRILLAHEYNGSSSDVFPWLFRAARQGTIVGTRTAGAAVGSWYGMTFQDGGEYIVPMRAFFNPAGTWDIENQGVAPDVTVVQDPRAVLEGRDPQLERAVDLVLRELQQKAAPPPQRPAPLVFPRNGRARDR
jgi:tricorn protease